MFSRPDNVFTLKRKANVVNHEYRGHWLQRELRFEFWKKNTKIGLGYRQQLWGVTVAGSRDFVIEVNKT